MDTDPIWRYQTIKRASILEQNVVLAKRGLIKVIRWPITSFIRFVIIPGIIFGISLYGLISGKLYGVEQFVNVMLLLLTCAQVYICGLWLVIDKETGFKSLMLSMGLRKSCYYSGNTLVNLVSILPIMWVTTAISIIYLFKESLLASYHIVLLFSLFSLQLSGYIYFWSSFITRSALTPILLIPLVAEGFIHGGVAWLMRNTSESNYATILFFSSMSPYESVKIFCDSYLACRNCADGAKYYEDRDLVSESIDSLYLAMTVWTAFFYLFAFWMDNFCLSKADNGIKSALCCIPFCRTNRKAAFIESRRPINSNYFEQPDDTREVGIEVNKLTKTYNKIPVVNNLSFRVYKGETTLLLGHNGAGKTTLMNMMLSHVTPDQGEVSLGSRKSYAAIGLCPQNSILDDNLTVREHLELFCSIKCSGMGDEERARHIKKTLEDVGLTSNAGKISTKLSGGMKRKLSLGMAFVGQSSILILDEPSSGLDPDSRVFVWNAIRRYRGDRTVLLSTQHMEEADYLGDRIAIMSAGSIICCGSSIFLNNTFGAGYKLRVECDASTKQGVLRFIRDYFGAAKIVGDDGMVESRKDATVDFVVELSGDKSQDLEAKLIAMLEKIEEDGGRSLKIRSHGLRSSSIEDVMLNTSSFLDSSQNTVQVAMSTKDGHLSNLVNTLKAETGSSRVVWALLVKHWQVYASQWMSIVFFRILVPIFCLWYKIRLFKWVPDFSVKFNTCCMILHYIQFPIVERFTGFKTVQLASKASLKLYWLSFILADSLSFLFNIIVINVLWKTSFIGAIIGSPVMVHLISSAAVLMYSLSGALMAYVLSSSLSQMKNAMGLYLMFFLSSIFGSVIVTVFILVAETSMRWKNWVDLMFIGFLPSDAFQYVIFGLYKDCYVDQSLEVKCEQDKDIYSPVVVGFSALGLQIVVYGLLLFLIETKRFQLRIKCCSLQWFKFGKLKQNAAPRQIDEDVLDERAKARQQIKNPEKDSYSLVALNLSKSYVKNIQVIDKLSFTVEKGECFGLLGVNGAGKSTTFAMVVAEIRPDSGRIWLNGHYNDTDDADQYRSTLGYDPQPNPDIALTPVQALTLMARLRQVEEQSIPSLVESLLEVLDMAEHGKKLISDLSGGTKRKLGLGMSLIGNPLLLALDEPTAGVDPLARRGIWRLLRQLRTQSGASILISSHAMEECEAICDRISIMARGRIRCIGTFLHLRNKFSQGCSIRVQFSSALDKSQVSSIIMSLNDRLQAALGHSVVKLVDSNANSATFSITDDRVQRSRLFKILREFREENLALSYMVNDSSLEDIFLTMAKEEQQGTD